MIYNLFSYASNFGAVKIYKCDYFGYPLSEARTCFVDSFTVSVDQQNVDEHTRFGELNQSSTFRLSNRKIKISSTFLFELDASGVLSPGTDLLFNLCAQAFQGTNISYKLSTNNVGATSLVYNESLPPLYLQLNTNFPYCKFFLVSDTDNYPLTVTGVDTNSQTIYYQSAPAMIGTTWVEVFQYGGTYNYPLCYEPMFRIDTSEGSFYSCLIDKITLIMNDDYVKISVDIVCTDYDRSTRYDFINAEQILTSRLNTRVLHKSRIKIDDFQANSYDFNVSTSTLEIYNYMNGLITQSFKDIPVTELSLSISNNLEPIYGNNHYSIPRTYVKGYVSKNKKIEGSMSTLALRSVQPTFDKFPFLTTDSTKSLSLIFGPQQFNIPYTVWSPGKLELKNSEYVTLSFNFVALTNIRQGQPDFINDNLTNF